MLMLGQLGDFQAGCDLMIKFPRIEWVIVIIIIIIAIIIVIIIIMYSSALAQFS